MGEIGIPKHMGEWRGKMGRDGFAQEFPQQERDPSCPGAGEFEPSWVALRGLGWWGQMPAAGPSLIPQPLGVRGDMAQRSPHDASSPSR